MAHSYLLFIHFYVNFKKKAGDKHIFWEKVDEKLAGMKYAQKKWEMRNSETESGLYKRRIFKWI